MKYRVMAKMLFERRHHQEGPNYDTREEAETEAAHWNRQASATAHVEPVQGHRTYAGEANHATD